MAGLSASVGRAARPGVSVLDGWIGLVGMGLAAAVAASGMPAASLGWLACAGLGLMAALRAAETAIGVERHGWWLAGAGVAASAVAAVDPGLLPPALSDLARPGLLAVAAALFAWEAARRPRRRLPLALDATIGALGLTLAAAVAQHAAPGLFADALTLAPVWLDVAAVALLLARSAVSPGRPAFVSVAFGAFGWLLADAVAAPARGPLVGSLAAAAMVAVAVGARLRPGARLTFAAGLPAGPLLGVGAGLGAATVAPFVVAEPATLATVFAALVGLTALTLWRLGLAGYAVGRLRGAQTARSLLAPHRVVGRHVREAVLLLEPDSRIGFASPAAAELLGDSIPHLLGSRLASRLPRDPAREVADWAAAASRSKLRLRWRVDPPAPAPSPAPAGGTDAEADTAVNPAPAADARTFEAELVEERWRGGTRLVAVVRDATDAIRAETARSQDALTGCLTRDGLVAATRGRCARPTSFGCALVAVELDGLETFGDVAGPAAAVGALVAAAERFAETAGAGAVVGRLGAVTFASLLDGPVDAGAAQAAAGRVLAAFRSPLEVGERRLRVVPSVGVAWCEAPDAAEAALADVALAVREAARLGGDRSVVYDPALRDAAERAVVLAADLPGALARDGLELLYAPVANLATRRVVGLEARPRWEHPDRGPVAEAELMAAARAAGLAVSVRAWAIRAAAAQLRQWDRLHPHAHRIWVSIGVDDPAGDGPANALMAAEAVRGTGVAPSRLVVRLPAAMFAHPEEAVAGWLTDLSGLGISLAVEGVGPAVLTSRPLRRCAFRYASIDPELARTAGWDEAAALLARADIAAVAALGAVAVAPGIERAEQLAGLVRVGCQLGAGPHLEEPKTGAEFAQILRDWRSAVPEGATWSSEGPTLVGL